MDVDIELTLIPRLLQSLNAKDLVHQFRSIDSPNEAYDLAVTNALLKRIHAGIVPPPILTIWIPIVVHRTPGVLYRVIMDKKSRGARQIGLSWLPYLNRKHFQARDRVWEALGGGIEGLAQMLNFLPPGMTKRLAYTVGTNAVFKETIEPGKIDELVRGLLREYFTTSESHDNTINDSLRSSRPYMALYYMPLLHACEDDTLIALFTETEVVSVIRNYVPKLLITHSNLLRKIAVGHIQVEEKVYWDLCRLWKDLLASKAPYQPSIKIDVDDGFEDASRVHPGICFCVDLMDHISIQKTTDFESRRKSYRQHDALGSAIEFGIQSRAPFRYLFALLKFAVEKIQFNKDWLYPALFNNIAAFWSMARFPDLDYEPRISSLLSVKHPSRPAPGDYESLQKLMIFAFQKMCVSRRGKKMTTNISSYSQVFQVVPKVARLDLVKLCLLHSAEIDLNSELNEKGGPLITSLALNEEFLLGLPAADASWLLNKVLQNSDSQTLGVTFNDYTKTPEQSLMLLKIKLEAQLSSETQVLQLARKTIKDNQKEADRAKDSYDRSDDVNLALENACATGSIKLLKSVLLWTESFLRDPLQTVGTFNKKLVRVLSCVRPTEAFKPTTLEDLSSMVNEANAIMEWAISLIPKYQSLGIVSKAESLTQRTALTFAALISDRARSINRLHSQGLGSFDELRETLIDSQLPLLVRLEENTRCSNNERISRQINLDGVLDRMSISKFHGQHVLPLLDNLAEKRSALFRRLRISKELTPKPDENMWCSQGLPVQNLCGNQSLVELVMANPGKCPYIFNRFETAIFCDQSFMHQVAGKESFDLDYVDSLVWAISQYINPIAIKFDLFKERLSKVWKYYSESLNKPLWDLHRLKLMLYNSVSPGQNFNNKAMRYCSRELNAPMTLVDSIPSPTANATEPLFWDPRSTFVAYNRELPRAEGFVHGTQDGNHYTVLQILFLDIDDPSATIYPNNREAWRVCNSNDTPQILPVPEDTANYWTLHPVIEKLSHLPFEQQEALSISALLFLDQAFPRGTHPKLLEREFPEGSISPRYPAMALAEDFVNNAKKDLDGSINAALGAVHSVVNIVPPQLLRKLAESLLSRLAALNHEEEAAESDALSKTTFGVISLLDLGDQPQLAIDVALDCVNKLPHLSSWHRKVLSLDLHGSLTAEDSVSMVRRFAGLVMQSLISSREASQRRSKETTNDQSEDKADEEKPKFTPIKITTVKILPDFLNTCQYLSLRSVFEILQDLSRNCVHIDVRAKILELNLELLGKAPSEDHTLVPQIYKYMERFIRLAAGPNDRNFIKEDQWERIEAQEEGLPDVQETRRLQDIYVSAKVSKDQREEYSRRIMLPLVKESIAMNSRWMRTFLKKVRNLSEEEQAAANEQFGPFDLNLIQQVWQSWFQYLPREFLDIVRQHFLGTFHHYKLRHVPRKIKDQNPDYRNDKATQTFIDYTNRRGWVLPSHSITATAFNEESDSKIKGGISRQDQLDFLYWAMDFMLQNPFDLSRTPAKVSTEPFMTVFSRILQKHVGKLNVAELKLSWVEKLVRNVETKSTLEWKVMDPNNRTPCVLPLVTELKKQLILAQLKQHFHFNSSKEDAKRTKVLEVVKEVQTLIRQHAEGYPNTCVDFARNFAGEMRVLVGRNLTDNRYARAVLVNFGTIPYEQHPSTSASSYIAYLCELNMKLGPEECKKDEQVKSVLRSWISSPNQEIRDHLLSSSFPQELYLDVVSQMT